MEKSSLPFADLPEHVAATLVTASDNDPERWQNAFADVRVADSLARVWRASEFVANSCLRDSALLEKLAMQQTLFEPLEESAFASDLEATAGGMSSDAELLQSLRKFRRRHMVRIAWRDIAGWAELDETLRELSWLADACIRFAYTTAYRELVTRYGTPRGARTGEAQTLLILGMGKLGGYELNFSSDIDLVYLYPEDGETDGTRSIENAEFFLRLAQRLSILLATPTVDGFVYRMDLRLRPFGDSGPVAVSFSAFEDYLQKHGRDWERYAYVKARPIVGEEHYESLFGELLRPFVYRRYLDFGVFEALREMKALIAKEVERRELEDNVKLGPGGIREIEFIVQAYQLLRGGSDRRLQLRQLMKVLPLLEGERLLTSSAVAELKNAYGFLRRLENRLQEWNDEQTHGVPQDPVARARLAASLGYAEWVALESDWNAHRERVTRHFARAVFGPTKANREHSSTLDTLLEREALDPGQTQALAAMGFESPERVIEFVRQLREGYARRLDETGRRRLKELLPRLLDCIGRAPHPDITLSRIARILERIGGRTVYLALLNESDTALKRLVDLCARSGFLAEQIAAHPLLLDELIGERGIDDVPTRAAMERELKERRDAVHGEDAEAQVEMLRKFQRAAVFRIAVADLTERLPLMKVSDRLTDLAELIVREGLELAWENIVARHGAPLCGPAEDDLHQANMTVVAYGKFGGIELGYGSDLDLVLLHDSSGAVQRTAGPQVVDSSVFFQRVGQRFIHFLTVHSAAGRLYEVDSRLRPGGNRGLLVQSVTGFEDYQRNEAWTWEHQALLRTRAVAGPSAMCERFETLRIELLRKAVRRETLREEVRKMRGRMRTELTKAKPGEFDLKQDAGGIADLEFLVQYWTLLWADRYPEIVIFSDNIRQLESLASGALVPQARVDFLTATYRLYRTRLHHLALDGGKHVIRDDEFVEERAQLVEIWNEAMEQ